MSASEDPREIVIRQARIAVAMRTLGKDGLEALEGAVDDLEHSLRGLDEASAGAPDPRRVLDLVAKAWRERGRMFRCDRCNIAFQLCRSAASANGREMICLSCFAWAPELHLEVGS